MSQFEIENLWASESEQAASNLEQYGVTFLPKLLDQRFLGTLRDRIDADLRVISADGSRWVEPEFRGHILTRPPTFPPFLNDSILFSPVVLTAVKKVLRYQRIGIALYLCNINMPGSALQNVHADFGHLWPNTPQAHPPSGLVLNIPLVDMTEENGATEIWPCTHLDTSCYIGGSQFISEDRVSQQRLQCPPLKCVVPAGTGILRDGRLWHAGVPNLTSQPRPMLTVLYVPPFVRFPLTQLRIMEADMSFFRRESIELNHKIAVSRSEYLGFERN